MQIKTAEFQVLTCTGGFSNWQINSNSFIHLKTILLEAFDGTWTRDGGDDGIIIEPRRKNIVEI